jgi:HSP20 family protein
MLARYSDHGFPRFALGRRATAFPFDALMDRLFDFGSGLEQSAAPTVSFEDRGDAIWLRAEVPGFSEKELGVTVTGSVVTLTGERKADASKGTSDYRFSRTFDVGTKLDSEKVDASLVHGVLTVTLPKATEAQAKQIAIRVGT